MNFLLKFEYLKKSLQKIFSRKMFLSIGWLFLIFCGCQNNDVKNITPDLLYNNGIFMLKKKDFLKSSIEFSEIFKRYPNTSWERRSLLYGSFSFYKNKDYDNAIKIATRYIDLYSEVKDVSYAYYIIGICYYDQIPNIEHDQKNSHLAIDNLQKVVDTSYHLEDIIDAKHKIELAREKISSREMKIGKFYLEKKQYVPAIKHFRDVVEQYSKTVHIKEALYRLVEAYYAMGVISEARSIALYLNKHYKNSDWSIDANNLLLRNQNIQKN